MVTSDLIMSKLPPYADEWRLINAHQYVPDIMQEICNAHLRYAEYYDCFSLLFYTTNPDVLCESLYWFCKRFITYQEESVKAQTSAVPTGILYRGFGDCKHYALFCAGVIDSLNRLYDTGFDWSYYFAGYNGAEEPYHVFVCVRDAGGTEVWLDPTPGSGGTPTILISCNP